jgi:transposase
MWHIGIDLHRRTVVMAMVHDSGDAGEPTTFGCRETDKIVEYVRRFKPFRAVIEATSTYRWLYDLLSAEGEVLLAHPAKLRLMIQRRAKTDRLDCQLLANLLRINQIPLSYVPPKTYQRVRDVTRYRSRLISGQSQTKIGLRALLARHNREAPYRVPFGPRGLAWFQQQEFGGFDDLVRDELVARLEHYRREVAGIDERLKSLRSEFRQVESLLDIHGVGLYTALVIVGELGEIERFRFAHQVGAYAGLTSRVRQSGDHCYYGKITRQGSPWLRCVLVEAAIHVVRRDAGLRNFYQRIRKRSGSNKARVATARKLAEICWKRLRRWHREHEVQAA